MADVKKKVESVARYYGGAAKKSDARAGFKMSASELGEYARDKFEDNFREMSASKYKAHFVATLRAAYNGKASRSPNQKRLTKAQPKQKAIKAETLVDRACRSKHIPAFMKRYC